MPYTVKLVIGCQEMLSLSVSFIVTDCFYGILSILSFSFFLKSLEIQEKKTFQFHLSVMFELDGWDVLVYLFTETLKLIHNFFSDFD